MAVDGPFEQNASIKLKGAGRSMFGQQADSRKASLPTYSFSHNTNRDQASKVFLSQAHVNADHKGMAFTGDSPSYSCVDRQVASTKATAPSSVFGQEPRLKTCVSDVPGPGTYASPSSLGDQTSSPKVSQPKFMFSHTTREESSRVFLSASHQAGRKGQQGPPPGSYEVPAAVGHQPQSSKRSSPAFAMSKTDRLKDKYEQLAQSLPAVGHYETWASIGKQPLSQFKTLPSFGFRSSSGWEQEGKRFLTSGHTEGLKGTLSPANFSAQTDASMTSFGKQLLSQKLSVPSLKFGSSQRFSFKVKDTPGPGHYE